MIIVSYLLGFVFSILFPNADKSVFQTTATVSAVVSMPLMLLSCNWKNVLRQTKEVLVSFTLLIISVLIVSYAVCCKMCNLENGDIFAGMAVGLYTGGTMNLNAIASFFGLDNSLIFAANISDIIFGGIFYSFLLFGAKPVVSAFLGKKTLSCSNASEGNADYSPSALEKLNRYVCCVFSFCITAMISTNSLKQIRWKIFIAFALITVFTFIVHLILCKIFNISAEIMIITATAGIYGPAFIPSVSSAIGSEDVAPYGLIMGSFGYAIGTFIGIGFTYIVNMIP